MRRLQSGLAGEEMVTEAGFFGGAPLKYLGDWHQIRIADGELPKSAPPRPQGVERNVVITTWQWGTEKTYMHDLISSDRRNPAVNANGPLFGSPEYASDDMPILDPKDEQSNVLQDASGRSRKWRSCQASASAPSRCSPQPIGAMKRSGIPKPTITTPCSTGRAASGWLQRCGADNPAFCKKGSDHPSARVFPLDQSGRQSGDPRPKRRQAHS